MKIYVADIFSNVPTFGDELKRPTIIKAKYVQYSSEPYVVGKQQPQQDTFEKEGGTEEQTQEEDKDAILKQVLEDYYNFSDQGKADKAVGPK